MTEEKPSNRFGNFFRGKAWVSTDGCLLSGQAWVSFFRYLHVLREFQERSPGQELSHGKLVTWLEVAPQPKKKKEECLCPAANAKHPGEPSKKPKETRKHDGRCTSEGLAPRTPRRRGGHRGHLGPGSAEPRPKPPKATQANRVSRMRARARCTNVYMYNLYRISVYVYTYLYIYILPYNTNLYRCVYIYICASPLPFNHLPLSVVCVIREASKYSCCLACI